MAQLSQTLRELTKLQNQDSIPVCANMDLVNTLRVSIFRIYTISTVLLNWSLDKVVEYSISYFDYVIWNQVVEFNVKISFRFSVNGY